jgi:hypothetical protein
LRRIMMIIKLVSLRKCQERKNGIYKHIPGYFTQIPQRKKV